MTSGWRQVWPSSMLSAHKLHRSDLQFTNRKIEVTREGLCTTPNSPHSSLQSAYNLYGKATFKFFILETVTRRESEYLLERENHYLLQLDRSMVYNMTIPATIGGTLGTTRTPEHRAAISRAAKGHTYLRGIKRDPAVVAHIAALLRGRKHTPEQIAKAAAAKAAALTEKPDIYKGEQNGRAKLTTENVKEIRRLYETGLSQTRLGEMFGVCQTVVSKIVLRKSWEHVE